MVVPEKSSKPTPKRLTRIRGNIGIQWYHFEDLKASGLNFNQPSLRLNFKVTKLWNRDYNIRIRFRSRYNERTRRYSNDVPETEWRNRIYEASFSYDNLIKPVNFKFGRIISNTFSGIGYIDGIQLQHNAGKAWRYGIFAGTQPEWQYSELQTSIQKYGLYFNYLTGDYSTRRWESTIALAGAYHGSTVSREFLYLQNSYNYTSRLNIYQNLELDLNRDWRKEKTNESFSISGLYVSTNYKITNSLNMGLSYDNRKNYYTYELRSLADSLFDAAFRHGIRARLNFRILKNMRIYGNFGWRKRQSEGSNTYSYSGGINLSNILAQRINISARYSGFTNYYTDGHNPSIRISKSFRSGHNIGLSYGTYLYTLKANKSDNVNQWFRFNSQFELPLRIYVSGSYEYDWGDDVEGSKILVELGYRF